jgi:hypothetical protein
MSRAALFAAGPGGGSLAVTNARVVAGAVMQSYAGQLAGCDGGLGSPGGRRGWVGVSADGKFGSDQCATVRGGADVE